MSASAHELQLVHALLDKYRVLHALRLEATPDAVSRATFVALSRRFPGALRELDRTPMHVLEQRLAELERFLRLGPALQLEAVPDWMRWQLAYHGFMRAALRIRVALRRLSPNARELAEPRACLTRVRYRPAADEPAVERFDADLLGRIHRPAGGRLNGVVLNELAREFGVPVAVLEQTLFWGA